MDQARGPWLAPYRARPVQALLGLGFGAGLPLLLTGSTLSAWLASERVDLRAIGLFSLVGLPYSLKFLWAPLFDVIGRGRLPSARRRGPISALQLLLAGALLALGAAGPAGRPFALLALLVALLSASQDIVVDAYRADALAPAERAAGSASYVLGYRGAMVAAGTLALVLSEHLSWRAVYGLMAALMLLCVPLTLLSPEPPPAAAPPTLRQAAVEPLRALLGRPGAGRLLGVVVLYKVGDALVLGMLTPFLLQLGFSRGAVGTLANGAGLAATLAGTLAGGVLVPRLGLRRALLLFGACQAAANLGYVALALTGASRPLLTLAVIVDNLCGGLGSTAFVAFLMGLCDRGHSATQYAVLSSLSGVAGRLIGAGAGHLALRLGWPRFFLLTIALALPGLWLLRRDLPPDGA